MLGVFGRLLARVELAHSVAEFFDTETYEVLACRQHSIIALIARDTRMH